MAGTGARDRRQPQRLLPFLAALAVLLPALAVGAMAPAAARHRDARSTDGWWYQVMHLPELPPGLTGKGVTVAMLDGTINLSPQELHGADISLRTDCRRRRVHQGPPSNDHGTSMAAYIVGNGHGTGPGGAGILGVAPGARLLFYGLDLMPSPPGRPVFLECTGLDEISQINAAVRAGADIITTSTDTTDQWPQMERALHRAFDHGVVVVAASGSTVGRMRDDRIGFPAGYPGVVAVNAADRHARPWHGNPPPTFTDVQTSFPVISAPGVHVNSLLWYGGWQSDAWATGTSPATAIVAGALALVKQKYPAATGNQLVQQLIHFTGGTRKYGWDPKYGFGIVSVPKMLAHDPTRWPDVNPLLHGPHAAVRDFPMSSYGKAAKPAGSGGAAGATKGAQADGQNDGRAHAKGGSDGSSPAASGTLPAWVWVVVALVVAGAAAVAAATWRRRTRSGDGTGRTPVTDDQQTETRAGTGPGRTGRV